MIFLLLVTSSMMYETKEEAGKETLAAAEITTSAENTKKPLFARIFHR